MSFSRLNSDDKVLSVSRVSTPVWSNSTDTITSTSFTTNAEQTGSLSGNYYINAYYKTGNTITGDVQFAVAYLNVSGSGSTAVSGSPSTPSKINYEQYRSLVLGDEDQKLIDNSVNSLWAITIDRARYRETLDPATFQLELSGSNSVIFTCSLDSKATRDCGSSYEIKTNGDTSTYGWFLPEIGTLLLKDGIAGITASTTAGIGNTVNALKMLSAASDGTGIKSFKLQSEENLSSNIVFIRAKNSEFNYSMNPTCVDGEGNITVSGNGGGTIYANNPRTYITSVGLYNDNNDLLAVAKLSKPLEKSFDKEALIRVKLDF